MFLVALWARPLWAPPGDRVAKGQARLRSLVRLRQLRAYELLFTPNRIEAQWRLRWFRAP